MIRQKTVPELLKTRFLETPQEVALWTLDSGGYWIPKTYHDLYYEILDLASKLMKLGVNKGHIVAIVSATGYEWEMIHHAVLLLGGVVVGIDPNEIAEHLETIVRIGGIQTIVIDKQERLDKYPEAYKTQLQSIITFDTNYHENDIKTIKFSAHPKIDPAELKKTTSVEVQPEDIATIIFTSGTTGTPKGIAYQHIQIITAIDAILNTYPELSQRPCNLVCWLPLANLFQRIVNLCAVASGAEVYFVQQPQRIVEFFPQINPHIFIAVPRFYEKLYQELETTLNHKPKLINHFLHYCLQEGEGTSLKCMLFRKINRHLFKSFSAIFGKNIRYLISGSAPIPLWLLKRYQSLGLLILEAYGISENVIPIAANSPSDYQFGTVGKPLRGNSIMLAEDGELLVKGIGVFHGYLNAQQQEPNPTKIDHLATGDYAEIDENGYIRLTGRKSEVFKTSTGRKIAPTSIEALLKSDPSVEHAVIFGENKKFLVALITITNYSPNNDSTAIAYAQEISKELIKYSLNLPEYKRPAGLILSFKSLSIEQKELTINLKLRRKEIQQHYLKWIDDLYNALDDPKSIIHHRPILISPEILLVKL